MFVVDRERDLVGYSAWPWGAAYSPVVGCYRDGRCVAFAPCDQAPHSVGLLGPSERVWFRMKVDGETRAAIEDDDGSVRLVRMEDGDEVHYGGPDRNGRPRPAHRLEQFLSQTIRRNVQLDGFLALLSAPFPHQVDALFLDIFGRAADPGGRANYSTELDQGHSILSIRNLLMRSDEFANRRITISDRVGALLTSPIWHQLARCETPGDRRAAVKVIRIAAYEALTALEFAARVHLDVHGDTPTPAAQAHLANLSDAEGRIHVASLLIRDAAVGGNYVALAER